MKIRSCFLQLGLGLVLMGWFASPVLARSGGIDGYSGNPATNGGSICNACHSGGQAPVVVLDGPVVVEPSTVHTYTLTITGGQEIAGGLGVSATAGTLAVVDPGTHLDNGEITHDSPRNVDGTGAVSFSFNWNAPAAEGTVTLYGAGNSVNLGQGNGNDLASADTLTVTVAAATAGPGESSGAGLEQLLVTARDPVTGAMTLSYESGCEATDNNLYYGPLSSVSTYGYSGDVCDIGTGGVVPSFDPGSGSFFFLVVGNKSQDEGSYGLRRLSGAESERPPDTSNTCGQVQDLADRCD